MWVIQGTYLSGAAQLDVPEHAHIDHDAIYKVWQHAR